jgi:hypothetical protein
LHTSPGQVIEKCRPWVRVTGTFSVTLPSRTRAETCHDVRIGSAVVPSCSAMRRHPGGQPCTVTTTVVTVADGVGPVVGEVLGDVLEGDTDGVGLLDVADGVAEDDEAPGVPPPGELEVGLDAVEDDPPPHPASTSATRAITTVRRDRTALLLTDAVMTTSPVAPREPSGGLSGRSPGSSNLRAAPRSLTPSTEPFVPIQMSLPAAFGASEATSGWAVTGVWVR